MGVRGHRYDIWTDAGRPVGSEFLIARDISDSMSWQVLRCLEDQGWTARKADHDPAVGSPRQMRPRPVLIESLKDEDTAELSQEEHWQPRIV